MALDTLRKGAARTFGLILVALLVVSFGLISTGWVKQSFMPEIESDEIVVNVVLPEGAPYSRALEILAQLQDAEQRVDHIDVAQIEEIVAKIARIPSRKVSKSDSETMRNLQRDLQRVIYGQDEAIEKLALLRGGLGVGAGCVPAQEGNHDHIRFAERGKPTFLEAALGITCARLNAIRARSTMQTLASFQ